ncbi:MAG: FG-GAP repeat protein [Deltaproteobacteria bacterium]|nr:FG-GAP repeat protein [Deltaproteobacteria bacterium]
MTSRGSLRHMSGVVSAEDAELVITSQSLYGGEGLNALILDDQDADGRAELLIGFPRWNISGYPEGAMYVAWGETVSDWLTMDCDAGALLSLEHAALTTVDEEDNLAGTSVAILNDLDGDGLSELVIGAPEADSSSGTHGVGEVRVLLSGGALSGGGAEVAYTDADITIQGAARGDYFGEQILATGDMDGDGLPELVVLAPGAGAGAWSMCSPPAGPWPRGRLP